LSITSRRRLLLPVALFAVGLAAGLRGAAAPPAVHAATPAVRVDQLGYAPGERKLGYLLAATPAPRAPFHVERRDGTVVLRGRAGASTGVWNTAFRAVEPLDLTSLRKPGTYRVVADLPQQVASPWFRIARPAVLFLPRVADTVAFFQANRDGADVIPGALHRRPSHLHDTSLTVYQPPRYESPDSDVILGKALVPIGGPVDLVGGWMDAGDFLKFTHTTAYAATLLLAAARALGPSAPPTLLPEARHGLAWLHKAWDPRTGVLYLQVGIGSGNKAGTFFGDHDVWRLPEKDDGLEGPQNRYLRSRPAFRANAPGTPVPPNLAGRVAAAFAIAAQIDARTRPALARSELDTAASVYAAAKTVGVAPGDVETALPHAFYPESSWRDDLELGGAELALAARKLDDPRASTWLRDSAHWARAYLDREAGQDTLNLYDTSALAHADLIRALRAFGSPGGLAVGQGALLADLRAQLRRGLARAAKDPFRSGAVYDDFDAAPHTFGLVVTARLYHDLTGDARYDAFATGERDWALGANAWGASLMIGVGQNFPLCPQHVVANLSGSLDGRPPILRGAVVNGPNDATLFQGGLGEFFSTGRTCPPHGGDAYAAYTGHGSRYVDDVRSWQTVEPALDFTATAALAFALSA